MLAVRLAFWFSASASAPILLAYHSPLLAYSFLASDFTRIVPTNSLLPLTRLTPFLSSIKNNQIAIKTVKEEDCSYSDLQALISSANIKSVALEQHGKAIVQLAGEFSTVVEEIRIKLREEEGKRVVQWMRTCRGLGVLDLPIWSRLLAMATRQFAYLKQQQQGEAIDHIHWLLKSCFMSFNFAPGKFVYRENYLVDLGNIRSFLLAVLPSPSSLLSPGSFQQIVGLIDKIVRTAVLNTHEMAAQYNKNEQYYLSLLEKGNLSTANHLLRYFAIIGMADPKRIEKVQKRMMELWPKERGTSDICLEVSNVLWAWNGLGHSNPALYAAHIRPEICYQLERNTNEQQYTSWLYNIVGCQIDDLPITEQLLSHATRLYPLQNKILHTINHYLSVRDGIKREGSYSRCKQNDLTVQLVKQSGRAYSACMLRSGRSQDTQSKLQTKKIRFEKEVGFEENPPQQFWARLLNKAYLELLPLYKSKGEIRFNFEFCVFELDAFLTLGGVSIAFELTGSHYRLKVPHGEQGDLQGRKRIKYAILQAYGLKILEIDSTGLVQRNINSFQQEKGGVQYLKKRLAALLPPPDSQI